MIVPARVSYGPAQVALQIVSVRGILTVGLLFLPLEGCGMGQALALGESPLGVARSHAADRCRIAWRGDAWSLTNHCRRFVCGLNGHRVRYGTEEVLQVGDTVEFDLMRFQFVELRPASRQDGPREWPGLGAIAPGIHAADGARLLDAPLSGASRERGREDPLVSLHREFVHVVRNPLALISQAEWRGDDGFDPSSTQHAPSLEDLSAKAGAYPTVGEVLAKRPSIDSVLDRFDDFGAFDPAEERIQEDVLRLFAADAGSGFAPRLPALTRREHHALSIDSAMSLGDVRPGEDR